MMKKFCIFLALYLLLPMPSQAKERYSASRIYWDNSSSVQIYIPGGYGRIRELQNGDLMMICVENLEFNIRACRSTDGGKTWSDGALVASPTSVYGYHNAELIQLSDGSLIACWGARPRNTDKPFKNKYWLGCKISKDNGKTWGPEIVMFNDTSRVDGCWEPAMLELPSGELQCYFADESIFPNSSEQRIAMMSSWDKGLTWSEPRTISFRAGHRDGMPVPLLLADGKTIAVAIEDNGAGGTQFRQMIVRTDTADNWRSGYVTGTDTRRNDCYSTTLVPKSCNAAAPYITMLPETGEIVESFQGNVDGRSRDDQDMFISIGTADARNFVDLEQPFHTPLSSARHWNSCTALKDGRVLAVSGLIGNGRDKSTIETKVGYPKNHFEAIYSPIYIDGKFHRNKDHWTDENAEQVIMGCSVNARWTVDFTYSKHYLNFVARIPDKTMVRNETSMNDGVYLFIDALNTSADKPVAGTHQFFFDINGKVEYKQGVNNMWTKAPTPQRVWCKVDSSAYIYRVEVAIPWDALGINDPTVAQPAVAFIRFDRQGGSIFKEDGINGASRTEPWTWVPLELGPMPSNVKDEDDIFDYDHPQALPQQAIKDGFDASLPAYDIMGREAHSGLVIQNGQVYWAL